MQKITIPYPDDWHCHFRDYKFLERTVFDVSHRFKRAIAMPNLIPPITTTAQAKDYQQRILKARPKDSNFEPLMTLYLTEKLSPDEITQGQKQKIIYACKLYPAGATTHSDAGVKNIRAIYPLLTAMQDCDMPLLIHGEVVDHATDILNRETQFIKQSLVPIIQDFPKLRIVLEHISTKFAVDFIQSAPANVAATITPHHLLLNLNDLLADGIKPHYYCKPILKQQQDQAALIKAAISGNPKFFLGTDSAPHSRAKKECAVGCAGVYSAHAAIECYVEIFEKYNALDKLKAFASEFGAKFYQLPINQETLTLVKKPWEVPDQLAFGDETLIPLFANQTLHWQIEHE
jgi:dihydroorotase